MLALSVGLLVTSARAEGAEEGLRDQAREYAEQGILLYDQGDYVAAVHRFADAYRLFGAPTIGIRLARALVKLRRLVEESRVYDSVLVTPVKKSDPAVFAQALKDAGVERAALTPRIPTLTLRLAAGVTSPELDGVAIVQGALGAPVQIDPGSHTVSGAGAAFALLAIGEGEHVEVVLRSASKSAPIAPPSNGGAFRRAAGISALGLGGAFLAIGVAGAVDAHLATHDTGFQQYARLQAPGADACQSAHADRRSDIVSLCRNASTGRALEYVFFPTAALLVGAGIALFATSAKRPGPATVELHWRPRIGVGAAGFEASGSF